MKIAQANLLNGAALAYIGDAIYEAYIRQHVLSQGWSQVNKLHRAAVPYVEAAGQSYVMQRWLATDQLSEEELGIYKRGRNHKANTKAKNASIADYRQATGFEALLGWLYLTDQSMRLEALVNQAIQWIEERDD